MYYRPTYHQTPPHTPSACPRRLDTWSFHCHRLYSQTSPERQGRLETVNVMFLNQIIMCTEINSITAI